MATKDIEVRIHALLKSTRANGPGERNAVWFQGCTRGCPGCFNPETHPRDGGEITTVEHLAKRLLEGAPDGVSISGGEPLEQPAALLALLQTLREQKPALSLLLFTGHTHEEIRAIKEGPEILDHLDILIAGPYEPSRHLGKGLITSGNQTLHLLTSLHKPGDLDALPATEIILRRDGTTIITGPRSLWDGHA